MASTLPEFRGLDPLKPVRVYRRNLPHWQQDGATYFVTFRLMDSIPASKVREWQQQRERWCAAHGLGHDMPPEEWQSRYRGITVAERDEFERRAAHQLLIELDLCHGCCVLHQEEAVRIVSDALLFNDSVRYRSGDFTVMPNHVHWLVLPLPGHDLDGILGGVKGYTAHAINKQFGTTGHVWQRESHDRLVRDAVELVRTRTYISNNPIQAQLSSHQRTWHAEWLNSVQAIHLDT